MSCSRPDRHRAALAALALLTAGSVRALAQNDLLWSAEYDSPAHRNEWCEAVAYDPGGNLIGAGWEYRPDLGTFDDIRIFKYDPAGRVVWTRTYDEVINPGLLHGDDDAFGVATDAASNVYVCGHTTGDGATSDAWLRKYDPDGNVVWTVVYDSPAHDQDVFWSVAVSPDGGTVYVAGSERRPDLAQSGNWLVQAYQASTGALVWSQTYNDALYNLYEEALGVTVDPSGNLYVTGYEVRYDPYGYVDTDVWTRRNTLENSAIPPDGPFGLIDAEILLFKYSPAGAVLWSTAVASTWPAGSSAQAMKIGRAVVATGGDVIVVGSVAGNAQTADGFNRYVFRWRGDGAGLVWARDLARFTATPNNNDFGWGGAVGTDGVLHVTGTSAEVDVLTQQGYDLTIDDLDPATGLVERGDTFNLGLKQDEFGLGVAAGSAGIYAIGGKDERKDLGQHDNWLVRVYAGPQPVVATPSSGKVWPNPFNPATAVGGTLKFGLLVPGTIIRLYTPRGYLVRTLHESGGMAAWDGRNDLGRAAGSGVYLYQMDVPGSGAVRGRIALVRE